MKIFDDLVQDILRERWASSPIAATLDGVHEQDHRMDIAEAAYLIDIAMQRKHFVRALDAIPDDELDLARLIDKRTLLGALRASVHEIEVIQRWRRDPTLFLRWGLQGLQALVQREFAPRHERAEKAMLRAQAFPRLLNEAKRNIVRAPRALAELAHRVVVGAHDFFSATFRPFVVAADPVWGETATLACLQAVEDYRQHIEKVWLAQTDADIGIGKDALEPKLAYKHALPLTPEQWFDVAEQARRDVVAEIERVTARFEPRAKWTELIEKWLGDGIAGDKEIVVWEEEVARARDFVVVHGLVPAQIDAELSVVAMPAFLQPLMPCGGLLRPAPLDKWQRSFLFVPTGSVRPVVSELPVLVAHQCYPGHHVQYAMANRASSVVRKVYVSSAATQGWAAYAEQQMHEYGYFAAFPVRLLQLRYQLLRACRAVLDVRVHAEGIGFEDAVAYLAQAACLDPATARAEVFRCCAQPGHALGALAGYHQILNLRRELAMRARGRFSSRIFHERFLAWGCIPAAHVRAALLQDPAFAQAA